MTKRTIKLDASSLIYLVKAGSLDLIGDLYQEVIITGAVYQEAVIEGKRRGHPDAFAIERAVADGRVHVLQFGSVAREQLVKAGSPAGWARASKKPSLRRKRRDVQPSWMTSMPALLQRRGHRGHQRRLDIPPFAPQ